MIEYEIYVLLHTFMISYSYSMKLVVFQHLVEGVGW